ncbi:phosphate ABC transporter permease subunit PstC [Amphibacillus sp. Q70]|uniref:phosphate ABC transporter permease subunit PstC n=1 Tax=Amphibacillus sp. Q70 TaxID=3453416 RepID=UPI003F82DE2C
MVKVILLVMALISVLSLGLIGYFIFQEGLPFMLKYGVGDFIFGMEWDPLNQLYGIFPMIVGTVVVTILALLLGAPIGIAVAIFLTKIAPAKVARVIRPTIDLLAGIPSVVYGLFGMVVIRALLRHLAHGPLSDYLPANYQTGYSVLAGSIILAIMILPTIITISSDAIHAVPSEYDEAALGLGASKWQSIATVVVPAAKSGIISSIVLGIGRALGETMAIIMVVGNTVAIPEFGLRGMFAPVRTLTGNVALEMGYAGPEHRQALFATGIILFIFIMILNSITLVITKKED